MQNILALLVRFGTHIVFLLLELLCFYLIINYNKSQQSIFLNSTSLYASRINAKYDQMNNYLALQEVNDSLLNENRYLLQQIIESNIVSREATANVLPQDSLFEQYEIIPATICNKTIHLRNNHLTLCKGAKDGIQAMMGVVSAKGVVGIVKEVSDYYAHVVTIQHSQSRISCAIGDEYAFGNLVWKDKDVQKASLDGVPKHSEIAIGDTIRTSGYSAIFPPGVAVGKISKFEVKRGSNNYNISVDLFNNLANLEYVYVIKNNFRTEQLSLENE